MYQINLATRSLARGFTSILSTCSLFLVPILLNRVKLFLKSEHRISTMRIEVRRLTPGPQRIASDLNELKRKRALLRKIQSISGSYHARYIEPRIQSNISQGFSSLKSIFDLPQSRKNTSYACQATDHGILNSRYVKSESIDGLGRLFRDLATPSLSIFGGLGQPILTRTKSPK